jgi:hypothetical protein
VSPRKGEKNEIEKNEIENGRESEREGLDGISDLAGDDTRLSPAQSAPAHRGGRSAVVSKPLKEIEDMDTTAKVDIRRLQLLNDRIAQTIEALNQVRLSVHGLGLSHTTGNVQGFGLGQVGGNVGLGFGNVHPLQALQALQGAVPWGQNIGMNPGIQHTSPFGYQQGIPGLVPGLQQGSPFGGFQQGIPGLQQGSPFGGGYQQGIPGLIPGLQHASPFGYQQGIPGLIPGLQQGSPFGYQQQGVAGGWGVPGQNNAWGVPNQGGFGGGLAHTSPELLELQQRQLGLGQIGQGGFGVGLDPYTAARILQSFPFAQSAVPGLY